MTIKVTREGIEISGILNAKQILDIKDVIQKVNAQIKADGNGSGCVYKFYNNDTKCLVTGSIISLVTFTDFWRSINK